MQKKGAKTQSLFLSRETISRVKRMRELYLLLLVPAVYIIVFNYVPMYGLTLAFKDFAPRKGIMSSPWNNFEHFKRLFGTPPSADLLRLTALRGLTGCSISS